MMHRSILVVPLVCVAACSESMQNREEITVWPDGSLHVVVRAEGPQADLADGYPVPLGAPWTPVTASATDGRGQALAAEADFADVSQWPERFAPDDAPHADATARRSARLDVRRTDGKTVYAFTRTFHAPAHGERNALRAFKGKGWLAFDDAPFFRDLPKDLVDVDEDEATPADQERFAGLLRDVFVQAARSHARSVALSILTEGDASLDPARVEGIVDAAGEAVGDVLPTARVRALWQDHDQDPGQEDGAERLAGELRDALRAYLARSLAAAGVSDAAQDTARQRLEGIFAAVDGEVDLWGEGFTVVVEMPGAVAGGDYDLLSHGRAFWHFDGDAFLDGDVVLHVVSVVE